MWPRNLYLSYDESAPTLDVLGVDGLKDGLLRRKDALVYGYTLGVDGWKHTWYIGCSVLRLEACFFLLSLPILAGQQH